MALQHLHSSTANKRPTPGAMSVGQLAINLNTASPGLFFKDSAGALIKVGPVHVGTTAPNASPASGGETGNTVGEQWLDTTGGTFVFKVWDGSAWRSESGTFVDVNGDVMTGALGIIAGSAGSPGLYFSGDTNTGLYSPGADQVAISTNGAGRLFVDAGGTLKVGTSADPTFGTFPRPAFYIKQLSDPNSSWGGIHIEASGEQSVFGIGYDGNLQAFSLEASYRSTGGFRPIVFKTGSTERLRITSAGLVGVGTSSPSDIVHINKASTAATVAYLSNTGGEARIGVENNSGTGVLSGAGAYDTVIRTAASTGISFGIGYTAPAIRIDSSGRLGVGTTSPGSPLTIESSAGNQVKITYPSIASYFLNATSGGDFAINKDGTERLRVTAAGLVGVGTSSPQAVTQIRHSSTAPSLSTNTGAGLALDGTSTVQVNFGTNPSSPFNAWIQTRDTGTNSAWPLAINPLGGNVGVGTTSPSTALDVNGGFQVTGSVTGFSGGEVRLGGTGSSLESAISTQATGSPMLLFDHRGTSNTGIFVWRNGSIGSSERMRLDASGRLGIGTSSPSQRLTVAGNILTTSAAGTDSFVNVSTVGVQNTYLGFNNSGSTNSNLVLNNYSYVGAGNAYGLQLLANGTPAVTIDASQRVGIGTTSPARPLDVNGSVRLSSGSVIEFGGTVTNFITGDNSSNYLAFGTNSSERARIDSSGRLLVGTSSAPSAGSGQYSRLVIQGFIGNNAGEGYASLARGASATSTASGDALGVLNFTDNTGATFGQIACVADATPGTDDYPGRLVFSTTADGASSPTERMRIGSNGTVIITQSNSGTYGEYISFANGGYGLGINNTSGGAADLVYFFSPNYVGGITTSGSTTSYLSASDYRLKENIALVTDSITRLQQLKPIRFNFIADPTKTVDGFIAHEVQSVVPEAITGEKDAVDDEGNPVYQGIDQSKLVPLLTAALQEAIAKIESLESRLTAAGI